MSSRQFHHLRSQLTTISQFFIFPSFFIDFAHLLSANSGHQRSSYVETEKQLYCMKASQILSLLIFGV
jgi:hypothetical protein